MNRLPLKLTFAFAALVAVAGLDAVYADHSADNGSGSRIAQNFQYTPYNGQNNTPDQPPPQDAYTPSHPAGSPGAGAPYSAGSSSGDAYQGPPPRQNDDTDNGGARAATPSGDTYSPPPTTASRGDAYSPSQGGASAPPPDNSAVRGDAYSPPQPQGDAYAPREGDAYSPPRGAEGPPVRDPDGGMPRVEVQAAAPDDGLPYNVREHDARRAAIEGWKGKVADRFGPEFSHWRAAADKHVDCHPDRRDGIICTASAQPVRGLGQGPADDDRE